MQKLSIIPPFEYLKFCVHLAYKRNQYEFRKHPKIKWLDGELQSPTSGLPVQCSTKLAASEDWLD